MFNYINIKDFLKTKGDSVCHVLFKNKLIVKTRADDEITIDSLSTNLYVVDCKKSYIDDAPYYIIDTIWIYFKKMFFVYSFFNQTLSIYTSSDRRDSIFTLKIELEEEDFFHKRTIYFEPKKGIIILNSYKNIINLEICGWCKKYDNN